MESLGSVYFSPIGLLYINWGMGSPFVMSTSKYLTKSIKNRAWTFPTVHMGHNYVFGGGVQDVLGGIVVHHEGVVTSGPQILETPYHGGVLVLEYGIQHL